MTDLPVPGPPRELVPVAVLGEGAEVPCKVTNIHASLGRAHSSSLVLFCHRPPRFSPAGGGVLW